MKATPIERYRQLALLIDKAQQSRKSEATGNEHVPALVEIAGQLRSSEAGKHELLRLLDDDNPTVRLWAASHSLDLDPKAEATLRKLGRGKGYVAAMASVVLMRWTADDFTFPG